jgi:hypothetical protein
MQQRLISGKGILKVPSDFPKARYYTLYCDVNRKPKNEYLNYNFNPPRSRYATLGFFRDGYLQFSHLVEFPRQSWDFISDISSQNLIAIKCAYDGILQTFTNLGLALSQTPGGVGLYVLPTVDKIKDYEYLNFLFDEIRAVCYADTSIELKIYVTKHDTCDPDKDKPKKPPPPPPPRSPRPPGEQEPDISSPYDPGSDPRVGDGGNTDPSPIDKPPVIPDDPNDPYGYCLTGTLVVQGYGSSYPTVTRFYTGEPRVTYRASDADIRFWGVDYDSIDGAEENYVHGQYQNFVHGGYSYRRIKKSQCNITSNP